MALGRLSDADRAFFTTLGEFVFANPFSARRNDLLLQLAPGAAPAELERDHEALARIAEARIAPLLDAGCDLTRIAADDRACLQPALLYVRYHRSVPQLDALIGQQARQPGAPLAVPFGDDALAELARCGFAGERGARYFAFFFQIRRAFYFIEGSLAGDCPSMRRLREALWNNVFTHNRHAYEAGLWERMEDFSTLLLGETGTGKGSAAAAIGRSEFIPYLPAQRRFADNFADTFIAINLSQFPETLIESELFGHRKGAFTGAIEHHAGVLERCNEHGALFLDEIGEVSIPVQIKLLQVLQDRLFTPVGGHEPRRFSGRVIAATNRPLARLRGEGQFRDDFFYRLCSDVIEVPTLRQRLAESPAELEGLVQRLVVRIAGDGAHARVDEVLAALRRDLPRGYAWPGNVRELEQAVRRILLTGGYAADMTASESDPDRALSEQLRCGALSAEALLIEYCTRLYRRFGTYAEVARRTGLDPRTTRKYIGSRGPG